jgi:hypothetical protein
MAKRFNLVIDRSKWLRGSASHLMLHNGCGCVIGHYLVAKGVPAERLYCKYGFGGLEDFEDKMAELGDFQEDEGELYFQTNPEADMLIGVNDGDPRSIHDQHVTPVDTDAQREAVLIRLMKGIGCNLKFVGA